MSSDEIALHEVFGDFDGIEGRAAEKLVSRDEHLKPLPVVATDVLADATGEDIVLRGRVERHRVAAVQRIVNDPHPLALREDLARLGGRDVVLELEVQRLGMGARDRHAHAGARELQRRMVEHLARLVEHLELFERVPVLLVELVDVGNEVVHQLVLEGLHFERLALRVGADLVLELVEPRLARARRRLVGRRDYALQALRLVERGDGLEHDRGRAVGVRDDAFVPVEVLGVHLRHDERDLGILAERAGVVDHLRSGLDDGVLELDRDIRLACEKDMVGKKVMVTAGPTQEKIDPVRYITNHSTGKMGYAIAENCMRRGAEVTLITGPVAITPPPFVKVVSVVSAADMAAAVKETADQQDIIIKAAAVADYRPDHPVDEKVKKKDGNATLTMERTEDILSYLGAHKKPGQFLCGFSMETEHMLENSRAKLAKKNADMIVANNLKVAGAGFGTDTNVVTLITADDCRELEIMSKADVASAIVSEILKKMC